MNQQLLSESKKNEGLNSKMKRLYETLKQNTPDKNSIDTIFGAVMSQDEDQI